MNHKANEAQKILESAHTRPAQSQLEMESSESVSDLASKSACTDWEWEYCRTYVRYRFP